jgi:hypothetical protein
MSDFTTFIGNGRVLNGEALVAKVRYEARVYLQYIEASNLTGGGPIPGLPRLDCKLSGPPEAVSLHDRLTLVMNDGSKLNFYALSDGTVKPTGGIFP